MFKRAFLCICIIIGFTLSVNTSFASIQQVQAESQEPKSMKELNSNIQKLEEKKEILDSEWSFLKDKLGWIQDFINPNLSVEESNKLEQLAYAYYSKKKELDIKLIEEIKNKLDTTQTKTALIELKKDFYKDLTAFISPEKLSEFVEYIKWDIELNEKNKEIKEELYKEKVELKEKVDSLKEKIEEHKQEIDQRLTQIIHTKLSEKLAEIQANPQYQNLPQEKKILFFKKTIDSAAAKRLKLEALTEKTAIIQKKIEIYSIMEQYLIEQKNALEQTEIPK